MQKYNYFLNSNILSLFSFVSKKPKIHEIKTIFDSFGAFDVIKPQSIMSLLVLLPNLLPLPPAAD